MRLTRVHVDAPLAVGLRVPLPAAAANHLQRVLRLGEGGTCVLFNGDGNDYDARIQTAGKRELLVDVTGYRPVDNESPLPVTLVQGVARGEKMDLILQKATELGVVAFVAVDSERSEVRLDAARAARRVAHWRSVLASACEQCGRARVPTIDAPLPLAAALAALPGGSTRLLLDPQGTRDIDGLRLEERLPMSVVLAVGPEGGWSPRDREHLQAAGFEGLRLGPRILRTETAGLAAVAALQARWGDLR
ncbi:MAG TPA: 16S rRNA (uracil(1498)-N(3))-methyltransferase [Xanthomonadaceae bacterium]|nr:16S rRNA (uracil(1498)-N(3))-methyltransferase [Xanthomonadaceae bacterium]